MNKPIARLFNCSIVQSPRQRRGFTLIELLIVISIIGVLSALLLSNMQDARARARDAKRKSDLKQVQKAIEMYRQDENAVPDDGWSALTSALEGGTAVQMREVPEDPLDTGEYQYVYSWGGQYEYDLIACLENASDPDADDPINPGGSSCTRASFTLTEP